MPKTALIVPPTADVVETVPPETLVRPHSKNRGARDIPPKSSHTASVTSHQGGLGVNSPPKRWWDLSRTTSKVG